MHKVAKAATVGSVGDLGRIAQALADADFNIESIGGSEVVVDGRSMGAIVMLLSPDEDSDEPRILETLQNVDLGNGRRLVDVAVHPALDLRLANRKGELARAARVLGEQGIDIKGVVIANVRGAEADVSLAFEDAGVRDQARDLLTGETFDVLPEHGARDNRG
jgi:hypothetical protein